MRLDGNDYSVHSVVIGRRIKTVVDLTRVHCEGRIVADHERLGVNHQTWSDPEHVAVAKALRRDRIGVLRLAPEPGVEIRALADYDTAWAWTRTVRTRGGVVAS